MISLLSNRVNHELMEVNGRLMVGTLELLFWHISLGAVFVISIARSC